VTGRAISRSTHGCACEGTRYPFLQLCQPFKKQSDMERSSALGPYLRADDKVQCAAEESRATQIKGEGVISVCWSVRTLETF